MADKTYTRIYRIGDRLIRAKTQSQAVVHMVRKFRGELKAKLASQEDMYELGVKGVKVETAMEEDDTPPANVQPENTNGG